MCWIAVLFHVNAHYPLIEAANREESRTRPSHPSASAGSPNVWAGRDDLARGPGWELMRGGLLAAITNRAAFSRDASQRSRGLLCLDTLGCDSPGSARSIFVDELSRRQFNPFILLCASHSEGWVGTWQGDIRDLTPGIHVVSNYGDVDDDRLPVVREARDRIASLDIALPIIEIFLATWGEFVPGRTNRSRFARPGATTGPYRRAWSRSTPAGRLPPIGMLRVRQAKFLFPRSRCHQQRVGPGRVRPETDAPAPRVPRFLRRGCTVVSPAHRERRGLWVAGLPTSPRALRRLPATM